MPVAFFLVAVVGALHTLLALFRARRPAFLSFPMFMAGWVAGDLALFHLAWQAAATAVFVALGALDQPIGAVALLLTLASWVGLVVAWRRHDRARSVLDTALAEALGDGYRDEIRPDLADTLVDAVDRRALLSPFRPRNRQVERLADIPYGEHRRSRLDVYRPVGEGESGGEGRPVLLQVHGGAWVGGDKRHQGLPLMYHLAARGWVCVAPNYRLSPKAAFPDHLVDVKRALAWVRDHGAEYGADPRFVIVTGGSAGGHLAALLALTANDPRYQPGFEHVDTSVAGAVPMYGVYDFLDRHRVRGRAAMTPFLARFVMKSRPEDARDDWEAASPIAQVHADAPPFFVVHGRSDSLAWVEDARLFVDALRAVSNAPVAYAEVPYAQHAFDIMSTVRSLHTVNAVACFAEYLRSVSGTDLPDERVTATAART